MKEFEDYTLRNLPRIAQHYGLERQLDKLFEEGEEMLEALREVMDNGPDEKRADHLIEEIGDVLNVADQIAYLLERQELLEFYRAYKIQRQLRRIRNGEDEKEKPHPFMAMLSNQEFSKNFAACPKERVGGTD